MKKRTKTQIKTKNKVAKSDLDINLLKEKLMELKNNILSDLKQQITYDENKDIGDEIDDVNKTIEKEMIYDLSSNEKNIIKEIDIALRKIENNTYGICELCKGPIEPKRLNALPYTRYCIKCQQKQDKK